MSDLINHSSLCNQWFVAMLSSVGIKAGTTHLFERSDRNDATEEETGNASDITPMFIYHTVLFQLTNNLIFRLFFNTFCIKHKLLSILFLIN